MKILIIFFVTLVALYAKNTDFSSEIDILSKDAYWHKLLHFRNGESEIDDQAFFLAKKGKTSVKDELEATLKAFLKAEKICAFPARFAWLDKKLNLSSKITKPKCDDLELFLSKIDARAATLIFPSAHVNSPASMFGHTLLRIDSSIDSSLVSYAINYAATTGDDGGLTFALKGLFGGYPGNYSIVPYYIKIKEYGAIEQRDIYEYKLNLNQEELDRMLLHLYEIHKLYAYYYFFDENCSYNLLWLLELARPSVNLKQYFFYEVSPLGTIRAMQKEGLVDKTVYRASKKRVLTELINSLGDDEQERLKVLKQNHDFSGLLKNTEFTKEKKATILDAYIIFLQYENLEGKMGQKEYRKRYLKVLRARNALKVKRQQKEYSFTDPLKGHEQRRAGLAVGSNADEAFSELEMKFSYHELSDDDTGFLAGTQINFFDTKLRQYEKSSRLESLEFLNIKSLAPSSRFFKPISWQVRTGLHREFEGEKLYARVDTGAGKTFSISDAYFYTLANISLNYADDARFALYPDVGFVLPFAKKYKLGLSSKYLLFDDNEQLFKQEAFINYATSTNSAIKLIADYKDFEQSYNYDVKLGFYYYF